MSLTSSFLIGLATWLPAQIDQNTVVPRAEQAQRVLDLARQLRERGARMESRRVFESFLEQCGDEEATLARNLAIAHKHVCEILKEEKQAYRAIPHARESVRLFRQAGDRQEAAQAMKDIALAYSLMGDWDRARSEFEHVIASCNGLPFGEPLRAQCLNNMEITYSRQNHDSEALTLFEEALRIHRAAEYAEAIRGVASCQFSRGISLGKLGRLSEATEALSEAIAIYERDADPATEASQKAASALMALGHLWYDAGQHQGAGTYFGAAIAKLQMLPHAEEELASALRAFGTCARLLGDRAGAQAAFERAEGLEKTRQPVALSPLRAGVRRLTDDEMRTTSGSWPFQECPGTPNGTCPGGGTCAGVTCTMNLVHNPICPGSSGFYCTGGGPPGCTNAGAGYKVCVSAWCFYCENDGSGATPCGGQRRPQCIKWTPPGATGCCALGSGCICVVNTSAACQYSDCT